MESIKAKNEQLVAELDQFCDYLVFDNEPEGELIHPVNNICEGEERKKLSAKLRSSIMIHMKKMETEEVPKKWRYKYQYDGLYLRL